MVSYVHCIPEMKLNNPLDQVAVFSTVSEVFEKNFKLHHRQIFRMFQQNSTFPSHFSRALCRVQLVPDGKPNSAERKFWKSQSLDIRDP